VPNSLRRRTLKGIPIILLALAVLIPAAAYAAAGFTDVDSSSPFVADIQWLADSGVTKGCNPPTNDMFCPKDNVTREQMAAFMHRLAVNEVVDAGTLEGHAASDFMQQGTIVMTTGGTAWLAHTLPPTTIGRNVIDTTVSGDGRMVLPLTGPASVNGVEYGLESFEFCLQKFSGAAYVTRLSVTAANSTGGSATVMDDPTDRDTPGCYTYDVGSAAGQGMAIIAQMDGGSGDTIRLGSVTTTWTTDAATP
jgi:hypothetical protein